jgi:hypothetical protein
VGRFAHFQPSVEQNKMEWDEAWIDGSVVSSKTALLLTRLRQNGLFLENPVNEVWWHNVVKSALLHVPEEVKGGDVLVEKGWTTRGGTRRAMGKCIIFSNFIEAIDSVANSISEALDGKGCYMRFTANLKRGMRERIEALQQFRDSPDISILLLDGVGAVGLDLSFVSNIYLLDPIWDKSQEEQVIARAHRLGARRAITVEKLVSHGTVEEMMERLATDGENAAGAGEGACGGACEGEGAGADAEGTAAKGVKRRRGEDERRARETGKVQAILTGLSLLPELPGGPGDGAIEEDDARRASAPLDYAACRAAPAEAEPLRAPAARNGATLAGAAEPELAFIPAGAFAGSRPGWVFQMGARGLGYYPDPRQAGSDGLASGTVAALRPALRQERKLRQEPRTRPGDEGPWGQAPQAGGAAGGAERTKRLRFADEDAA